MKTILLASLLALGALPAAAQKVAGTPAEHDFTASRLASRWDEAVPLGNAWVGSLVWQKGPNLRMSLDRADLWDLRPMEHLSGPEFTFKWIREQYDKDNYEAVQERFDEPYEALPGPSKIPGAALEFDIDKADSVVSARLYRQQALCEVDWESGRKMHSFVHATRPVGWFRFTGVSPDWKPSIVPPIYNGGETDNANDQSGAGIVALGYGQGAVESPAPGLLSYHQKGYSDFSYDVAVRWEVRGDTATGVWSVTSSMGNEKAEEEVAEAWRRGMEADFAEHCRWWQDFYAQSAISLPDKEIERQYYDELYKMGSTARKDSYPISLQSVWTADNGKLPPWKGDYHHDLNTQLSYWPFYAGNHLEEAEGYLETLWRQRDAHKAYTRSYFGVDGLNVPGVCTLTGEPMGGWIQYSFGPTVSAWLAQHFWLQWKYSASDEFLRDRAYPYLKDVATYLEQITELRPDGVRTLPLSSSPEFNDNSRGAWFEEMTNFDRALAKFAFKAASETASAVGRAYEAARWDSIGAQLPGYLLDSEGALCIAPGEPYAASHRHFSHMLAFHPLGLIDVTGDPAEASMIKESIKKLDAYGPRGWTGYSWAWLGNMKARVFDGEGAAEALRTFASCFCLPNGFHANGDQSGTGKSGMTYRPFTLEGNMAFAAGVQEMLLQSHTGTVRVFPAIPADWRDASFRDLRAMGAFLVSAWRRDGATVKVEVESEKGGTLRLANPFDREWRGAAPGQPVEIAMKPGEKLVFESPKTAAE